MPMLGVHKKVKVTPGGALYLSVNHIKTKSFLCSFDIKTSVQQDHRMNTNSTLNTVQIIIIIP